MWRKLFVELPVFVFWHLPINLLISIPEMIDIALSAFFGFMSPGCQSFANIKYRWKLLIGKSVISAKIDCYNGYLCYRVIFNDGDYLFFRA